MDNDILPIEKHDKEKIVAAPTKNNTFEAMPKRSRLSKSLENNSKKALILSILGIIAIVALIAVFGVPFLEKFAALTSREDREVKTAAEETVLLLPPDFDQTFEATNSAEISLSGTAEEGDAIKLYQNGKLIDEVIVNSDKTFTFSNIELKEGENIFKAKTLKEKKESRFSDPLSIQYRKEAPKLSVDYPSEGQSIGNKDGDRLQVEGTTDPDVTVTVNGFQAVVDDEGKFKYVLLIKGGENSIKVIASDAAGNKTELERKFTYNP